MGVPGLRSSTGAPLTLGELLGRGGEARVYALAEEPALAAKIYERPDGERARKLAVMLANVPRDPDRRSGHVSIAWPESLVMDEGGAVVGFVMPRIDPRHYLPLHQLYHPRSRRVRAPGMSWRYPLRAARNLCATIAALHEAGYVVGDLNESNILVDDRALVALVDLDSIQVISGREVFRCTVGKAEYTPPELQGRSFREISRRPASDRFGLAVLVFLLLMEGHHPFAGVHQGQGEPPGLEESIRSRRSPYFGRSSMLPPMAAPPVEMLGNPLRRLLERSLLGAPRRRADARALQEALEQLEEQLVTCSRQPTHAYRGGLPRCPWCERAAAIGMDAYPSATAAMSPPSQAPASSATGTAARRGTDRGTSAGATGAGAATRTAAGHAGGQTAAPRQGGHPSTPSGSGTRTAGAPAVAARGAAAGTRTARSAPPAHARAGQPLGSPARPAGFRGSWPSFHARLPLVSVLLTLLSLPALLHAVELRELLAPHGSGTATWLATVAAAALLPPLAAGLALYGQARRSRSFARFLFVLERVVRAALGATVVALAASLVAGLALGSGSVLAGDWLLLPSFWVVAFVVLLRMPGPRRS